MEIRPALPSDAPALAELGGRLFRNAYADQIPLRDMEAYVATTFTAEAQTAEIGAPGAAVLVAAEGADLVAYAQLRTAPPPMAWNDPDTLEIARFYLEPRLHGTGFASSLMGACLDWARQRGQGNAWLQVWEINRRAIAFYVKEGFRDAGQTTFQVGNILYRDRVLLRAV
ncbi:MAG: GNAT family N-acetyltransferase [Holophaga sp.]|nr:GNAT family N-acetyltransferase [Holophaga sp.]